MRIEIRLNPAEPAALALAALPDRERSVALRLLIRRHYTELPALIGLAEPNTTKPVPPPPVDTPPSSEPLPPAPAPMRRSDVLNSVINQAKKMQLEAFVGAIGLALAVGSPHAVAAEAPLSLDVNVASLHTEAWARSTLNQQNPGVGVSYALNDTWTVAGGAYWNSYGRWTAYSMALWAPVRFSVGQRWMVKVGGTAGLASGYKRSELHCAPWMASGLVQLVSPAGIKASIFVVPNFSQRRSGFLGFQLGFPLGNP